MIRDLDEGNGVEIRYTIDNHLDAARIGQDDCYDLEFVNSKDELLQTAMERYPKGCTFISRGGATIEDFDPEYPYWSDDDFIYICSRNYGNIIVYELDDNKWMDVVSSSPSKSTINVGDLIRIKHQRERTGEAYCNVKPQDKKYATHNGWAAHNNVEAHVIDAYYAEHLDNWFYKVGVDDWYSEDAITPVEQAIPDPTEDITSFPKEGQCKTIDVQLMEYIRKTRTPEGDQSLRDRAKALCWNEKGYWFVSRSSSKTEYTLAQLLNFITQTPKEKPMEPQDAQQFDYTPQGGFQLTLPPEIVGAALQQATQTHFRESEKKFEKHREDVAALVEKKKQMIETELYQKFEKTIGCDFVEFKTKVVEDYLTSKQVVIELGQEKKYEFSLEDKHEQLPKMVTFLQLFKQAMIVGPSGSGKSTMAKQAAEVMGLRYGAFSCNLEASKSELVGFANIDGYVESSFLDFYENGGVFLVDEYDSMSPSIAVVLNAAFDRTGMIAVPNRKGKTIAKKHKDFYCILAGNTWGSGSVEYQGREMQDAAFLDRFKMCRIFIDYDEKLEKNIAGKHHSFFKKVRNYVNKKVDGENFSTRSMYDAAMLLNNGFTHQDILTMMSEHWDEALRKDLISSVA
jgi:energy-coupling factor transporter ATP-binding protein EcfA2